MMFCEADGVAVLFKEYNRSACSVASIIASMLREIGESFWVVRGRGSSLVVVKVRGKVPLVALVVTTSTVCRNRRMVRAVRGDASGMVRVVGEFF